MSSSDGIFQTLLELLDRNDESTGDVWSLIRTLSTNYKMFKEVLDVDSIKDSQGKILWENLLENKSVYRKIYNFEIIGALLEDSEAFADNKRIEFMEQIKPPEMGAFRNPIGIRPVGHGDKQEEDELTTKEKPNLVNFNETEQKELWTKAFIQEGGFGYVIDSLLNYRTEEVLQEASSKKEFDMKALGFKLTLLKVFLI